MQSLHDTCFVISPIGDEGSDVRRHADQVLDHLIEPAASANGLKPIRGDQIHAAGQINQQVFAHIKGAPTAVAVLTGLNPNVMYELAIRHATGKPVAQLAERGTNLPFDISSFRTIPYLINDLDAAKAARETLTEQLRQIKEHQGGGSFLPASLLPEPELDAEQTRSLISLHQGSASYLVFRVIENAIELAAADPDKLDGGIFFLEIVNALRESRRLCSAFRSQGIGSVLEFLESDFPIENLEQPVREGLSLIKDPLLDAATKRQRLRTLMENNQLTNDVKLEKLIQERVSR